MTRALRRVAGRLGQAILDVDPPSVGVQVVMGALATVLLLSLALVDRDTPVEVSLVVVYTLPAVAVATVAGLPLGMALAGVGALTWAVAPGVGEPLAPAWRAFDAGVRFLVVGFFVVLVVALKSALRSARASERRSRDFLALAAHQLRTPVTGVRATAEALIGMGAAPAQERLLANLARESERIGSLVGSLLTAARLDEGDLMIRRWVDVVRVCEEEAERLRARLLGREVVVRVDPGFPDKLLLDPHAAREILFSLLDNAGRHAARCITLEASMVDAVPCVRVVDDGPGVPPGKEQEIFERFVSLDGHGGTGLGLALARTMARQLGGDLACTGGGFGWRLPPPPTP